MGFIAVVGVIVVKMWRVHAVSGTLSRRAVKMRNVLIRLFAIFAAEMVLLAITQGFGVSAKLHTVDDTQFEYNQHLECVSSVDNICYIMDLIVIIAGCYYSYKLRHVEGALSNAKATMLGNLSLCIYLFLFKSNVYSYNYSGCNCHCGCRHCWCRNNRHASRAKRPKIHCGIRVDNHDYSGDVGPISGFLSKFAFGTRSRCKLACDQDLVVYIGNWSY